MTNKDYKPEINEENKLRFEKLAAEDRKNAIESVIANALREKSYVIWGDGCYFYETWSRSPEPIKLYDVLMLFNPYSMRPTGIIGAVTKISSNPTSPSGYSFMLEYPTASGLRKDSHFISFPF